jgi:hypothetical protein
MGLEKLVASDTGKRLTMLAIARSLKARGITLTPAELSESPTTISLQAAVGRTPFGGAPARELAESRYLGGEAGRDTAIRKWVSDILDKTADKYLDATGILPHVAATAKAGRAVQGAARAAESEARKADIAALDAIADDITGGTRLSQRDAGQAVIDAVNDNLGLHVAHANAIYEKLSEAVTAAGVTSDMAESAPLLKEVLGSEGSAQQLLKSAVPSASLSMFGRGYQATDPRRQMMLALQGSPSFSREVAALSDSEKQMLLRILQGEFRELPGASEAIAESMSPTAQRVAAGEVPPIPVPWRVVKAARTGVGELMGDLERTGQNMGPYYHALSQSYSALTRDLGRGLEGSPELSQLWEAGNEITKQKYAKFYDQQFVRKLFHKLTPTASEDVVKKLMAPGEETNFDGVLAAIGDDKDAKQKLANGIVGYLRQQATRVPATGVKGVIEANENTIKLLN